MSNSQPFEIMGQQLQCKHCGHEWSEVHETVHKADEPEGYTGD